MGESRISKIVLECDKNEYALDETVTITVRFSLEGALRDSFTEEKWTEAYNANDVSFKLKYGIKMITSGGFRKKELGRTIDTYRKASIFWTRNPKLVNPMKDKRIWVQVAKNFEPFVMLTEDDVRKELFNFDEKFTFKASDLGSGGGSTHKISVESWASWQKHEYTEADNIKNSSGEISVTVIG